VLAAHPRLALFCAYVACVTLQVARMQSALHRLNVLP
jgi:hypothetical protein